MLKSVKYTLVNNHLTTNAHVKFTWRGENTKRIIPFNRTVQEWLRQRTLDRALDKCDWVFSDYRKKMIMDQESEWEKWYLPLDVRGLTILDVGAGEGETARLFLEHGAKNVVCIEPDSDAYRFLKYNSRHHPLTCLNKRFDLGDLSIRHDFLKMDIEGYEEVLLGCQLARPAVVEVHGLQLRDRFQEAGWLIDYRQQVDELGFSCHVYAYWKPDSLVSVEMMTKLEQIE